MDLESVALWICAKGSTTCGLIVFLELLRRIHMLLCYTAGEHLLREKGGRTLGSLEFLFQRISASRTTARLLMLDKVLGAAQDRLRIWCIVPMRVETLTQGNEGLGERHLEIQGKRSQDDLGEGRRQMSSHLR